MSKTVPCKLVKCEHWTQRMHALERKWAKIMNSRKKARGANIMHKSKQEQHNMAIVSCQTKARISKHGYASDEDKWTKHVLGDNGLLFGLLHKQNEDSSKQECNCWHSLVVCFHNKCGSKEAVQL